MPRQLVGRRTGKFDEQKLPVFGVRSLFGGPILRCGWASLKEGSTGFRLYFFVQVRCRARDIRARFVDCLFGTLGVPRRPARTPIDAIARWMRNRTVNSATCTLEMNSAK